MLLILWGWECCDTVRSWAGFWPSGRRRRPPGWRACPRPRSAVPRRPIAKAFKRAPQYVGQIRTADARCRSGCLSIPGPSLAFRILMTCNLPRGPAP